MPEADSIACHLCTLKTTSDLNFLLRCYICTRGFHHRCCRPPIPDEVLTSLINATFKNKPGKGIKFWKCYDCREGKVPPPLPGPATSITPRKRKQKEVIVISDDDDESSNEIVVSGQPSARKRGAPDKVVKAHIAEDEAEGKSIKIARRSYSLTPTPTPRQDNEDADVDVNRALPTSRLDIPPSPTSKPSRFGLLSPPTSVSGGSTMRFPSSTPFFPDSDGSTPGPSAVRPSAIRTEIHAQPLTSVVQIIPPYPHPHPSPPISARNSSLSIQMAPPPVPKTWKTEGIKQDLKLLSQQFRNAHLTGLAVTRPTARRKQPRKQAATKLLKRTNGKHIFYQFGTPE